MNKKQIFAFLSLPLLGFAEEKEGELPIPAVISGLVGAQVPGREIIQASPGPWGDLDYFHTFLEAPDSLIDLMPVPSQQTVWRFPGIPVEQVRALFGEMPLSPELKAELAVKSVWHISGDGVRVHPTARFVASLPLENRISLYSVLRRFGENPHHRSPIIVESGNVAEWLGRSGISDLGLNAIAGLAYPLGNSLAFSDLPYLLGLMTTDEEERAMLKALTRTRTLVLRLRVTGKSDFAALRDYWTAGHKYRDVLPLMESIQRVKGVERIDIAHLVPPLPRKLLYTYPTISQGITGRYPDSFWTSLNFFEFWANEDFLDGGLVQREIQEGFESVQPPYKYGDMLLMVDPQSRRALHASIYIADDIVYTKNGADLLRPWILSKIPDLVARLSTDQAPTLEGWRRKSTREAVLAPSGP